ncbi:hypothetical protein VNO77_16822 [Canavalia gladiata]|uniref:Uncharacterized protein n=1 Tax=Canavalia gladiata TaxID=3824 RepID=A0AAN9LI28_CANGL
MDLIVIEESVIRGKVPWSPRRNDHATQHLVPSAASSSICILHSVRKRVVNLGVGFILHSTSFICFICGVGALSETIAYPNTPKQSQSLSFSVLDT